MAINNTFITGITDLLILSILNETDSYMYEITKKIESYSDGLLSISANTIYTAAYKLESAGLISEYSQLVGKRRVRVYYKIEESGKELLRELLSSFSDTYNGVNRILTKMKGESSNDKDTE